jgi:hypothetical protein
MNLFQLRGRIRQAAGEPDLNETLPKTLFTGWTVYQPPSKYRLSYGYEPEGKSLATVIIEYFPPSRSDDRGTLSVVIEWDATLGDLGQRTQLKGNRLWFKDSNGGAKYYGIDDVQRGLSEAKLAVQALVDAFAKERGAAEESRELPASWKRGRIQVYSIGGMKTLPNAWRLFSLAAHEALSGDGWAVTHAPSGLLIGKDLPDEKTAKKAVERLLKAFPGLAQAMDKDAASMAVKAGGGPAKAKSILSAARRSAPKQPWQSSWSSDMKSALIAYDKKLEQRDRHVNPHRIALLLEALGRVEDDMKKLGTEASLGDLKSLVVEHFTAESIPEIKKLFKKWGEPWSPEDDRQVQQRDRKLFYNL